MVEEKLNILLIDGHYFNMSSNTLRRMTDRRLAVNELTLLTLLNKISLEAKLTKQFDNIEYFGVDMKNSPREETLYKLYRDFGVNTNIRERTQRVLYCQNQFCKWSKDNQ